MATQIYLRPEELGNISGDGRRSLRLLKELDGDSQGFISVTFAAPANPGDGSLEITTAAIGKFSGSGSNTTATPIQLTFDGGSPGKAATNGFIVSDFVDVSSLSLSTSDTVVVIIDILTSDANDRHFLYRSGSTENWIEIFNDAQTYNQSSVGTPDEGFDGSFAVYTIDTRGVQDFVASSDNAVHGHVDLNDGTNIAISDEYNLGYEDATRQVFAFFFCDSGTAVDVTNPVFRIDGGSDIPAQMVGSQAGGGSYIAWAPAPTGTDAEFQCNVDPGFSIYFEFVFSGYNMSDTIYDVGGDTTTGSSITVDKVIDGTTIGWMLANSVTSWGGTAPTLTSVANRSIFGSNRRIEVGVNLDLAASSAGATVSYSTAQRVLALSLEAPGAAPASAKENTGLHHIECGSPMGKKTNGILHPIRHGIVGWRRGLILPKKKLIRVSHTRRAA